MEFPRPEYWSGQPFPSPGDLPSPGIEPRSPTLQVDFLPVGSLSLLQQIFQNPGIGPGSPALQAESLPADLPGRPKCSQKRRVTWRRKWQHSPLFLPEESHGQRTLVGYSPWRSQRVGHDLATKTTMCVMYTSYCCAWHPTPVLLPEKSHGRRSLVGYSPWGHKESDTTERLHFHFSFSCIGEEMATHSSVLAWRIPGTGEPGGLPSMGSHRVGHD